MPASRPRTRSAAREHIVTIDTDSAPRIMFSGENFLVEDLPVFREQRPAGSEGPVEHAPPLALAHAGLLPGAETTVGPDVPTGLQRRRLRAIDAAGPDPLGQEIVQLEHVAVQPAIDLERLEADPRRLGERGRIETREFESEHATVETEDRRRVLSFGKGRVR